MEPANNNTTNSKSTSAANTTLTRGLSGRGPWAHKYEAQHLRSLLEEELHHRRQLEALLRQHNIDPAQV
jgi:hypothetical protein